MPNLSPALATAFAETNESLGVQTICDTFNARCDSNRITISVGPDFAKIPRLSTAGTGILLCEGTRADQAAGIFIACKVAGGAGQVQTLMQVAGTGDHMGETYALRWQDGSPPEIKTTGGLQECLLKWRS